MLGLRRAGAARVDSLRIAQARDARFASLAGQVPLKYQNASRVRSLPTDWLSSGDAARAASPCIDPFTNCMDVAGHGGYEAITLMSTSDTQLTTG